LDPDSPHRRRSFALLAAFLLLPSLCQAAPASLAGDAGRGLGLFGLLLLAVVVLSVLFTMGQMAAASIGPTALEDLEIRQSIVARQLRRFVNRLHFLEEQFSLAAMICTLSMILLVTRLAVGLIPGNIMLAVLAAVVSAFFIHLASVEILARNITLRYPARIFAVLVPPLYVLSLPVLPLVIPRRLFRSFPRKQRSLASVSDMHLRLLPSLGGIERLLDEEAFELIGSVREFVEATAEDVMTPRTEVEAIPDNLSSSDVYDRLRRSEYSRLVVYHETIDNVVGTLLAKEALLQKPPNPWSLLRKPIFATEKTRLPELLRLIRTHRTHLIVVLDEYGGMSGVVTLHDLFEMIVGHIEDVEDEEELWIMPLGDGTYRLNGRVELWEVNDELKLDLDEEIARTIGGLVFNTLGRVVEPGDEVEAGGVHIRVEETRNNRVDVVLVDPGAQGKSTEAEGK